MNKHILNDFRTFLYAGIGLILLAAVVGVWGLAKVSADPGSSVPAASAASNTAELRKQVETISGAPLAGHNPALVQQTSLQQAAAQPNGLGAMTEHPAAGAMGDMHHHVMPSDVIPDTKKTRVLASGCLLDYGLGGEQCLPATAVPASVPDPCTAIRKLFPKGISVAINNPLKLTKNVQNKACTP